VSGDKTAARSQQVAQPSLRPKRATGVHGHAVGADPDAGLPDDVREIIGELRRRGADLPAPVTAGILAMLRATARI